MRKKTDLTKGDIKSHLVRLSLPMMIGLIAVISFQIVDMYFISILGKNELAAISFSFPVTYLVFSAMMGLSIGVSSVISRLIGKKEIDKVSVISTQAIIITIVISLIVSLIGIFIHDGLFTIMGADPHLIPIIDDYMFIWFLSLCFMAIPIVGNASLRAAGDASIPGMIMVLSAFLNLILDPLFIFGYWFFPRMEVEGAAIASAIANIFSTIIVLYFLRFKKDMLSMRAVFDFSQYRDSAARIFNIALPVSLSNIINPVAGILVTTLFSHFGAEAVAAFGIVSRIEALAFIPMMALAMAIGPLTGQNWGAGINLRVRKTIRTAIFACIIWGGIMATLLFIFSKQIAGLFSDNEHIIYYASLYLMIVPVTYGLANIVNIWASAFNAIGYPRRAFIMNITKMLFAYVPYAAFGAATAGVVGAFVGIALCHALTGIMYQIWNRYNFPRARD